MLDGKVPNDGSISFTNVPNNVGVVPNVVPKVVPNAGPNVVPSVLNVPSAPPGPPGLALSPKNNIEYRRGRMSHAPPPSMPPPPPPPPAPRPLAPTGGKEVEQNPFADLDKQMQQVDKSTQQQRRQSQPRMSHQSQAHAHGHAHTQQNYQDPRMSHQSQQQDPRLSSRTSHQQQQMQQHQTPHRQHGESLQEELYIGPTPMSTRSHMSNQQQHSLQGTARKLSSISHVSVSTDPE